jgi:hypothetical protein
MRGKSGIGLFNALKKIDSTVKDEHQFEWLFVPKSFERTDIENKIINALWEDCKNRSESKFIGKICDFTDIYYYDDKIKGVAKRLETDFYLPKFNLIIELDELQHFTFERKITLDLYGEDNYRFDLSKWKMLCDKLNKKDSDPLTRDWKRAFRDSIRDLRARDNNVPLLRLYIEDFNNKSFESGETYNKLEELILWAVKNKC